MTQPEHPEHDVAAHRADLVMPYGPGKVEVVAPPHRRDNPLQFRNNRLNAQGWKLVGKRVVMDFGMDAMVDRAAALTYYAVLSLAPTVLALYSIAILLLPRDQEAVAELLAEFVSTHVPEELRGDALEFLQSVVGSPSQSTVALVVSVLVSLLSASAYVRSFSRNANVIYGRAEGRRLPVIWLTMWLLTIVLVAGAVVLIFASLLQESLVTGVLRPLAEPLGLTETVEYLTQIFLPVWRWVRIPVMIAVSVLLVALLYYFAPNVRPGRFRLLTLGSFFALLVIGVVWALFGLYLSTIGVRSAYGAFGIILALLVVLWAMNIVLLLGLKIDAEVLRAKELQMGLDSEHHIQAQPRAMDAVKFRLQQQRWADRSAREIKGRNA